MFYITGAAGLVWSILWFVLLSDEPKDHKCIHEKEIEYIENNRTKVENQIGFPPYCKIIMCPALWTYMFCDFALGWGLFTLLNDGPTFINKVLHQDITQVKNSYTKVHIRPPSIIEKKRFRGRFRNISDSSSQHFLLYNYNNRCPLE